MIKMIQKLKNKKGFTLVELIVVIAIIAILTAVIVPLIARYSAQAQYTTLMDAAQTVSNSANNAMSDANQIGAVNLTTIDGTKSGGGALSLTCSDTSAGTVNAAPTNQVYSTSANKRALEKLWESLNTTLPANCKFHIEISASAVAGVIYVTDTSKTLPATGTGNTVTEVKGFDNAYQLSSTDTTAVGVSGAYKPAATPTT